MRRMAFVILFACASTGAAQPGKLAIRFPTFKITPVTIDAPAKLTAESFYVVDSDMPILLLASPDGMVKVTEESGPVKVRGKFADGGPQVETRTYTGKQVFLVEAVSKGQVELLIIQVGATKADAVIRKMITVDDGTSPRPPPPDPPRPTDTFFPTDGKLRVLILYESSEPHKLTQGQKSAVFGQLVRNWLESNCAVGPDGMTKEYAIYDKDVSVVTKGELWRRAVDKSRGMPMPAIVISNGQEEFAGALPDDIWPLLKRYGGK